MIVSDDKCLCFYQPSDGHVTERPPSGAESKNLVPIRRAHSSQSVERGGKQREPGSASKGKRLLVSWGIK